MKQPAKPNPLTPLHLHTLKRFQRGEVLHRCYVLQNTVRVLCDLGLVEPGDCTSTWHDGTCKAYRVTEKGMGYGK